MIPGLKNQVEAAVKDACRRLWDVEPPRLVLETPPKVELGDLALPIAFELAKVLRRPPRKIAEELAPALELPPIVARRSVEGGGYVNLFLDRPKALAAMRPSAYLINVARGRVVDEPALIAALDGKRIAGAALDCAWEEPLPPDSPLWTAKNVLITPHTAGETRRYEDNVIDLLLENLDRLWRGETVLKNQIA